MAPSEPQATDSHSPDHAHKSANCPIADQAEKQELSIKGGPQSESQHSALTIEGVNIVTLHIKKGVISPRHIKKGVTTFNRQPRCLARTDHSTAQPNMPLAALGPELDQLRAVSLHSGPLASLCRTPKRYTSTGTSPLTASRSLLMVSHPIQLNSNS